MMPRFPLKFAHRIRLSRRLRRIPAHTAAHRVRNPVVNRFTLCCAAIFQLFASSMELCMDYVESGQIASLSCWLLAAARSA